MLYKISLLTLIFALQHNVFANETKDNLQRNEFSRELSPLTQNQIKQQNSKKSFSMKKHITKKQSLELTIERGLAAAEFQSVQEIEQAQYKYLKNIPFVSLLKDSKLLSQFIYQGSKNPELAAKFLSLFIQFKQLFAYTCFFILSLFFGQLISQVKFHFSLLSWQHISYSLTCFLGINTARLLIFYTMFSDHLEPLSKLFKSSLLHVAVDYPLLSFLFL